MGNSGAKTYPEDQTDSHHRYYGYDEYDQRDDYDSGWYPEKDYGRPYFEESHVSAIKRKRSCTDIACLLLFFAFLCGWGAVAFLGFKGGDINKVIYPTDSQGNICGLGDLSDRRVLLMFDMTQCLNPAVLVEGCLTPQVCVERCPDESYSPLAAATAAENAKGFGSLVGQLASQHLQTEEQIKAQMSPYCKKKEFASLASTHSVRDLVRDGVCPPWYLKSSEILGRCLPINIKTENTTEKVLVKRIQTSESNDTDQPVSATDLERGLHRFGAFLAVRQFGERVFSDLKETYWMIGIALIGSCIISFIWIVLMRCLAGAMVYTSILLVFLGMGSLFCYCGYSLYIVWQSTDPETHKNIFQLNWTPEIIDDFLKQKDTWIAFTSIVGILLFIIVCLFIYLWKRIRIAIALIEEGSKAVGQMFSTLFFPLLPFLFQLVVLAWFLVIALFLSSWGLPEHRVAFKNAFQNSSSPPGCISSCTYTDPVNDTIEVYQRGDMCDPETFTQECGDCPDVECQFVKYAKNKDASWLQWVNLFGLYWGLFFFTAFGELVLAGVFSEWYWTMNKSKVPCNTMGSSLWNATVYHLGTVAFGSLIIAIIRTIRTALEYLEKKLKKFNNDLTKCLLKCCKCCLWCLEKFMRFINRNAYIMCAVKSTNFCSSAKDAFNLLMRNLVRVVVLDSVVDFLLFLGKLVIVILTGCVSYLAFAGQIPEIKDQIPSLNYLYTPIFFIVLGSYFIASSFFGVYEMAVDTLFLCFLEDLERNDGSPERPYYMSKDLRGILGRMNQMAQETRFVHPPPHH